ncbi:DUF2249 domain-containing protein [Afifella pfennigii]|uniref:DUF2249 domain-containing protein n=1 Tax=Afifella pfennigii TaxID=209897 RepID=UPI000551D6A0|nr:DUF2249 domain-containing protein [Afifella pfennigii]
MSERSEPIVHLDLRSVPRPQRHLSVFAVFDRLATGQAFELVNDHDPMGLFHYLQTAIPGDFTWQYVMRGPEEWRVRIGRA